MLIASGPFVEFSVPSGCFIFLSYASQAIVEAIRENSRNSRLTVVVAGHWEGIFDEVPHCGK
jgi:hypothetical protein